VDRAASVTHHTTAARAKPQVSDPDEFSAPTSSPPASMTCSAVTARRSSAPRRTRRSRTPTPNGGRDRAPRTARPDPDLEPPTPRAAATRICRALQRAPSASQPRSTRTRQSRSCRVSARSTDPTIPHLQRTHQPIPPSSLKSLTTANPTPATSTSTRLLPHPMLQDESPTPLVDRCTGYGTAGSVALSRTGLAGEPPGGPPCSSSVSG